MPIARARGAARRVHVEVGGERHQVTVAPVGSGGGRFTLTWNTTAYEVEVARLPSGRLSVIIPSAGHASHELTCHHTTRDELVIGIAGRQIRVRVGDGRRRRAAGGTRADGDLDVVAPMPGRIVRVLIAPGEGVTAGQPLVVVEAMKMENSIAAPADGVVKEVRASVGDSVEAGKVLAVVSSGEGA